MRFDKLRQAMIGYCTTPKGGDDLPPEYQRVEYISGVPSKSYIDTGILNYENIKVLADVKVTFSNSANSTQLFGYGTAGTNMYRIQFTYESPYRYVQGQFGKVNTRSQALIESGTRTTLGINQNKLYIGDIEISLPNTGSVSGTQGYIYLNGLNLNGSIYGNLEGVTDWYGCHIYKGTTPAGIYIPCYLKSDATQVGLYDNVSQTLFTSESQTPFVAGPDV